MVDHPHDQQSPLGGYIGDIVLPDLPAGAEALAQRVVQRLYLRRWLLGLSYCLILIFVLFYQLPAVPAVSGILLMTVGAAFIPREGVFRPLRLDLRAGERRDAEQALAGVLEGLPSPVILLDAQRRILSFNGLAKDLWPALRGLDHISSVIRDPGVLEAAATVGPIQPKQMVAYEQRVPIERHMEAVISWIGKNAAEVNSRAPTIMLHLRDLTEQDRMDTLRTDFVANASHELRTPLSSVIGFIETLQGAARNDDAARDHFLDIMARQARRMARLIDNLLSLSRIEMRIHLRPQNRVDLGDVVEHAMIDLEPVAEQSEISLHFSGETEGAWVLGDQDELIQVVSNLVENSIKYGKPGGNVWLTIERGSEAGAGRIVLTVRDDGPGIDEKHLPRLTERFYRASDAGGEKSGTGLGLAIVKHVITRHRGELRISSKVGEGSTFKIILDQAPASGTANGVGNAG
jgi:two-component system phosphate regulon sensor histidine kinase PhoR